MSVTVLNDGEGGKIKMWTTRNEIVKFQHIKAQICPVCWEGFYNEQNKIYCCTKCADKVITTINKAVVKSEKINFNCDYCGKENERIRGHYKKTTRHFCNQVCNGNYRVGQPR